MSNVGLLGHPQLDMYVPELTNELIFVKFINILPSKFFATYMVKQYHVTCFTICLGGILQLVTLWITDLLILYIASGTFEIPYSQSVNVIIALPIHYFSEFSHCTLS